MKKGAGNCLLHDNTSILDSAPASVNIARRVDMEPVEVRAPEYVPEEEILSDFDNLSEYKEATVSYMTSFIVK